MGNPRLAGHSNAGEFHGGYAAKSRAVWQQNCDHPDVRMDMVFSA
jgi:hypothetical protein